MIPVAFLVVSLFSLKVLLVFLLVFQWFSSGFLVVSCFPQRFLGVWRFLGRPEDRDYSGCPCRSWNGIVEYRCEATEGGVFFFFFFTFIFLQRPFFHIFFFLWGEGWYFIFFILCFFLVLFFLFWVGFASCVFVWCFFLIFKSRWGSKYQNYEGT